MNRKVFIKRLSKCSKESILIYLSSQFKLNQTINEIELIEYNLKSEKLLREMDRLNKLSSRIEVKTLYVKITFMNLHKEWQKTSKMLDELNEWFGSRNSDEVE